MNRIVLVLLLLISAASSAQKITVIYKVKKTGGIHTKIEDSLLHKYNISGRTITLDDEYHYYVLRIDGKRSLYYPIHKITNDTIQYEYVTDKEKFSHKVIRQNGYSIIYKDLHKKTKVSSMHTFVLGTPKDVLVSENLEKYDWIFTNDVKVINGYSCKKADYSFTDGLDRKRTFGVWYTEDIPVRDGPSNYWGLPGLILKVDIDLAITADKIIFDIDDFIVAPPTKGEKMIPENVGDLQMLEFNEN